MFASQLKEWIIQNNLSDNNLKDYSIILTFTQSPIKYNSDLRQELEEKATIKMIKDMFNAQIIDCEQD